MTPNLLDTDCHQIRADDSTNDILVLIRDKIFTGILNEERFYSKIQKNIFYFREYGNNENTSTVRMATSGTKSDFLVCWVYFIH